MQIHPRINHQPPLLDYYSSRSETWSEEGIFNIKAKYKSKKSTKNIFLFECVNCKYKSVLISVCTIPITSQDQPSRHHSGTFAFWPSSQDQPSGLHSRIYIAGIWKCSVFSAVSVSGSSDNFNCVQIHPRINHQPPLLD